MKYRNFGLELSNLEEILKQVKDFKNGSMALLKKSAKEA